MMRVRCPLACKSITAGIIRQTLGQTKTTIEVVMEQMQPTGKELAEAGMARALDAAKEEWATEAMAAIKRCGLRYPDFTADEFREEFRLNEHRPAAIGAVFRKASQGKLIEPTGQYRASKIPSTHSRPQKVWRATNRLLEGGENATLDR